MATEFLSAFAFANNCKIIARPGGYQNGAFSLKQCTSGYIEHRQIQIEETMDDFTWIAHIKTEEQKQLIRMYRVAKSANDIHLAILFLWHTIVFPSQNDNTAIDYIDSTIQKFRHSYYADAIKRILENPIFQPDVKEITLGKYIKYGIRGSIAHIVRNRTDTMNLKLDSCHEINHLYDIQIVLSEIAKHKLGVDYDLNINADASICRYYSPD